MDNYNEITSDFENQFDPEWYINIYTENALDKMNDKYRRMWCFSLDKFHELFITDELKGTRLLDVGTGPTISSIISASDHVAEIYLSDYAMGNRKVLFDWLNCKRNLDALAFQYILSKQESTTDVADKENEIRNKVKAILPIDVNKDLPLCAENDVNDFDVITIKLCLESACGSVDVYRKSVKNLVTMLRPGGHIVMVGLTGSTWYRVGDRKFRNVCLKHSDVLRAFEDANADVLKYDIKQGLEQPTYYNTYKSVFFLVAQRPT